MPVFKGMSKRRVTTLFAVVALAASAPAIAGPEHDHHEPAVTQPDPWATARAPVPVTTLPLAPALGEAVLALFGISSPRRLPNGAPACGNVASRAPRPVDCK
ncbi:MAG: hypothetical protein ABI867_33940 [Kofleriaceae bacterium]